MRLDLNVVHAPDIKSKQPWPRLTWLGKQQHDLLLLDLRRIKVLCLNGNSATKKKIDKLQSHLSHLVASNVSPNGAYLVCLLETGNLLLYHKDTNLLRTVPGIDQVAAQKTGSSRSKTADKTVNDVASPLVFISSDANCVLVVIGHRQLFLWQADQSLPLSSAKHPILAGTWSCVHCEGATLPHAECKETSVHATFFTDPTLGFCCICSFIFNQRSSIHISSVFLHWLEPYHLYAASQPRFTAQWSSLAHPLSELSRSAGPVRHRGAFLARHARDGLTLAVAVNQRLPADTRVLFASVAGATAVSVDVKSCGCRREIGREKARSYWLADIAWTADNLFLACVTKQGCLTMLSRLGEAVWIQSSGCSVEHEPAFFLPLHPLVTFIPTVKQRSKSFSGSTRPDNLSPTSSLRSEADEKRQRFSLAAHPSTPALLVSDGYLVTVIELPRDLSCAGAVRDFLSEGRTAVNLLLERQGVASRRLRTLSSLQLRRARSGSDGPVPGSPRGAGPPPVRTGDEGLLSTAGSDLADYAGRFSHAEEGRFVYGDPDETGGGGGRRATLTAADRAPAIVDRAQRALLSAWGMAVSHGGEWSNRLEDLLQYTAETIVKLVGVMLRAIPHRRSGPDDRRYASTLCAVLNIVKAAAAVLRWDVTRRRGLPTAHRLFRGTVRAIARHGGRRRCRLTTAARSCVGVLQFGEKLLTDVYTLAGAHQPTLDTAGRPDGPYHRADVVGGALLCRESARVRGVLEVGDHVGQPALRPGEEGGSRDWRDPAQEVDGRAIVVRHSPAGRLTQTWKLLHRHLVARYQKLVRGSSTRRGRGVRRLLLLLCGVQMKLKQLGCDVSVSLCDEWSRRIDASFLRGCQYYLQGYPEEAVACWHRTVRQTMELQKYGCLGLPGNRSYPGGSCYAAEQRSRFPATGSSVLLSHSLLAITYTHLEQCDLTAALRLADSLIECYGVDAGGAAGRGPEKALGRWDRLTKVGASCLGCGGEEGETPPQLPCVPGPVQREVVQTLARFMSLYFTNQTLFVYPPCAARPLPPLNRRPPDDGTSRTVPVYHDRIASSVRQQQLSDVWTADTAMALLLICGLLPEGVWLARQLGDWKSALMLSVMASRQAHSEVASDEDLSASEMLCLPEDLAPLVIVKEGIGVILQTPLAPPSPAGGRSVKRNSSFNEQDRRGSQSLGVSGGMRRSSSMCSINEEDRIMQEQLCRSLTDMLTAATVADLDPTPWLLGNLMDRCLSLAAEFNTLVPEEFYLPAPPFYCPQPDYEPKVCDPEEVLFESSLRREVNDVIQLIMLVLNSAKCSLACARWYVQQLDQLLTLDARNKKVPAVPLPSALVDHARFPVDLLKTGIDAQSLPQCTVQLLGVFRDLCSTVWMLHSRDKLTLAVRKYQASRERSLRVKPQNNAEVAKHSGLLRDVLKWADNLHPFTSFLSLEEEVQDILLTAIAELPPTKETVAVLARHFHADSGTENLSPLLQEKFQRLSAKLRCKREKSDRKSSGAGKESKRVVRYETLHQQYRYQCKLRRLAVRSRREEIGMCELQVFEELTEKDPVEEVGGGQGAHGQSQKSETAPSLKARKNPSPTDGKRDETSARSTKADAQYPIVGSREFESSPGYLDFLETFFLVAFGKIVQENAPFTSKPRLPLIGAYSSELRHKELGSVVRRMSANTKLRTVEVDASSLTQASGRQTGMEALAEAKGNLEGEVPSESIKSRSMFLHNPDRAQEDPQLISLKRRNSRSSLNSIVDLSREQHAPSPRPKVELPPFGPGILQPYSSIVLNLGEAYTGPAEMLQWFGQWAERQLAVYSQTSPEHGDESKAVLRVRLPQQLVLNSLWLVQHLYHPDLFEAQSVPESSVTVLTGQSENNKVSHKPHVQHGKSKQPLSGNLRREQRRNKQTRANANSEGLAADRARRAKTKRTSAKKAAESGDTDSENEVLKGRKRRLEKKARIQRNIKEKKQKEAGSKGLGLGGQEEVDSSRARKKRQLPDVTEAHRRSSPRHLSANKGVVEQLLLRAQSPDVREEAKRKASGDEITYSDLSDHSITTVRTQTSSYQRDLIPESSRGTDRGEAARRSDHPRHSKSERSSRRGILSNDVFYYSDSDTSSTLDISSLDEAEGTTNWLVDATRASPTSPEADGGRDDPCPSPQPRSAGESPKALKLDMKDEDVKRLVREEFLRIMMEKNKANSWSLADRNLPKSPDSPQPLGAGAKEPRNRAAEVQPQQLVRNERPSELERVGQSGPPAPEPADEGIDAETQAPSPLSQTWHSGSDARAPPSWHGDQPPGDALRDTGGDSNKGSGVGPDAVRSERAPAGLSQSTLAGSGKSDFRPGLRSSTPQDARNADIKSTASGRLAPLAGEPLMSPLSLEDLEGKDDGDNPNPPGSRLDPFLPPNADLLPNPDSGEHVSPTSFQSTFRFAMHLPLLLTVPPERLTQGIAGVRYPLPPPQGIDVAPVLSSRGLRVNTQPDPDTTRLQNAAAQYSSRAERQPSTQVIPGFIPPLGPRSGYENPVGHLVSRLHPAAQQQQYGGGGGFPPIPLLRMEPRHPAPVAPPPRYPLVPGSTPAMPAQAAADPARYPVEPVPLLQLPTDAKASQFVSLEELSAFERQRRRETEKHPAVRAREARDQVDRGQEAAAAVRGSEMVAPIPLLHAELRNDLDNTTRQKRRQQQGKKPVTSDTRDIQPGDTSHARPQGTRETVRLPADRPHPGDKPRSRREDSDDQSEDTVVGVKRLTNSGQDLESETRDMAVESNKKGPSRDTSEKGEQSSEVEETDSDEQDEREAKDATLRRGELGNGYAIRPGSFDVLLLDANARPAVPTAAQVHYDAVRQLQAKPKADIGTATVTKQTKSVSTSMGRDDFPRHPPTVADATSQYTALATGLADTGQIVAPDIFFNLRFGSTTSAQQPSLHDKKVSKDSVQANKGRSFISVVDVDLKDQPNLQPLPSEPQPPPSPPPPGVTPPTKGDGSDLPPPSPTNAELHYNALFLKDAHPRKTPPEVHLDEEEVETGGGPDAVTLKLLDRQTRVRSRQVALSKARSELARQSTKQQLSQRLAQMDQQLNAIEESASNIEQDFRNTSLMLHTVENLANAMAPADTRPKADYSLRDYRLPDHTEPDTPGALDAEAHEVHMRSRDSGQAEENHVDNEHEDGMVTEEAENLTAIDRGEDTALTLGISGISGVSDIIAEVIADGDSSDVLKMGVSTRQQKAARRKMEQRRATEDYNRLSRDQIRELLATPRIPRRDQDGDGDDRWPSPRTPAERSAGDRRELKEWAATRRAKSLAEYKRQREGLMEREHRPFHGEPVGPSSLKEIRKQEGERDKQKKDMIESSHEERVQQAKALMAEMFTERPRLPPEEVPVASAPKRKDRTLRESGPSERSSKLERRPAGQIPKGTYLFVDGGAYKPRPEARSKGGVGGRAVSRATREEDFGDSREREGEAAGGSLAGRLRSEERGSRGLTSGRDWDRRQPETQDSADRRFAEKRIAEFAGEEDGAATAGSGSGTASARPYRPKPFDQVVRVQRPEVTRRRRQQRQAEGSGRMRQKTYTEMLQEMKGETGRRKSPSQSLGAKQRLYGTERIPGSSKAADGTTPRFTKTYSERLSDLQQKSGGLTRLRPRTRPRGVPRIDTGAVSPGTFDDTPYRRRQVEGRGLRPEPTPRSSTPYHERLGTLTLSGTYRGRDDVVSPAPKVGVKFKPRDRDPVTYVERLQRLSWEARPTHRHKTVYVGPVQRDTYKSPRLRSPTARPRPYPGQGQRSPAVEECLDERSGFSDLSSWNVSDEVMDILHRRDSSEGDVGGLTDDDDMSLEGLGSEDYAASVNVRELEEIASVSSGSVLSNIDWRAVDMMIADVR